MVVLKVQPPPAAMTTNCRPEFLLRYVMGVAWPLASSLAVHSSAPLAESKARKVLSLEPPMKTSPPPVEMEPPRLGVPVGGRPRLTSSGTTPSGFSQAISPRARSTATSLPQGGCWLGHL